MKAPQEGKLCPDQLSPSERCMCQMFVQGIPIRHIARRHAVRDNTVRHKLKMPKCQDYIHSLMDKIDDAFAHCVVISLIEGAEKIKNKRK